MWLFVTINPEGDAPVCCWATVIMVLALPKADPQGLCQKVPKSAQEVPWPDGCQVLTVSRQTKEDLCNQTHYACHTHFAESGVRPRSRAVAHVGPGEG